jgi:hypothetical protein
MKLFTAPLSVFSVLFLLIAFPAIVAGVAGVAGVQDGDKGFGPEKLDWIDLFETGDFSSWTRVNGNPVSPAWTIEEGIVHRGGIRPGDIITRESYQDFELVFEWKISEGGNSGVKYRTRGHLGPEYQVLDDERHRDSRDPRNRAAALYNIYAANENKVLNPVGEWNYGRIRAEGNRIEHWLNGQKVVDAEIGSEEWKDRLEKSKFHQHNDFATWDGPILLQDHGDQVWYRNVKIRRL